MKTSHSFRKKHSLRFAARTLGWGALWVVFLFPVPPAANGKNGSTLEGFVTLNGKPAAETVIFLEPNPHRTPEREFPPIIIRQKDKEFDPAFAVIPLGTVIRFENLDSEIHNIQSRSPANRFDTGAHMPGTIKEILLKQPGAVPLRCRTHENMKGTVFVSPTPFYAVSGPKGGYRIPDIPEGTYQLKAWNPRMTFREQENGAVNLTISGENQAVQLDLSARAREGQDLSENAGKDWVETVKKIDKEMAAAVSLWKKGKKTAATRRIMSALSGLYGESGLKDAIGEFFDGERAAGYEKRFDAIRKQIQGLGPRETTEAGLRQEVEHLVRDLRNDAGEMTRDLPRQISG